MSSNVFIDSLADLSFTYLAPNQPVEIYIVVNANNQFFPLGVFIVNVPIRSTSTLLQDTGISASFSGRFRDNSLLMLTHPF
jgi:hypothetical protein